MKILSMLQIALNIYKAIPSVEFTCIILQERNMHVCVYVTVMQTTLDHLRILHKHIRLHHECDQYRRIDLCKQPLEPPPPQKKK